ncbi:hypothetical protein Btru_043652 [Bulinus truncatus]|nr:hypothetical protein Btru_043652 [Bulinus truncatus]
MSRKYSRSLLRISVAQICQNLGWHSAQSSSLEVLTDVLERYLSQLGSTCHRYAEQFGRTQANLDDLGLAFRHMGINISELEDYVRHVDPVPFAHDVVAFPAPKPAANLGFPNPRSREILQHREEHIPAHLPFLFPNMKDEIPDDKAAPIVHNIENSEKEEPVTDGIKKDEHLTGDKRPAGSMPTSEMPPSKRPRFGNSYLPEEVTQSQYEMQCVFMGPNGVLTTRQGVQGRLPEACMPPPNPRTLSEGANKENSGKSKEASISTKITIGVGGIGAAGLVSMKHDKKNKKSLHKKSFHHDLPSKSALDAHKDIGKKSFSSKAAAKFLKKLKANKKSSKLFSKPKFKEPKPTEKHESISINNNLKKAPELASAEFEGKSKKKKEKKSVAIIMDSDEELRNLSTPSSSCRSSPERLIITHGDGSAVKKAQLEAINDSINSVLREAPVKEEKVRKKKKKETKADEHVMKVGETPDGKIPEAKVKRKPGRPPKKVEPVPPPPPVDIKPFVSDKYSTKELEVYEFNDSPPHAVVSARRPNVTESVTPAPQHPTPAPQPPPPVSQPSSKPEHVQPSKPKVHKKFEPEEQLFAPEIKFDSMVKSVPKEKPKLKLNDEKKDFASKDSNKLKLKDDKNDKHKEKKDKLKRLKEHVKEDKDSVKEKDHKKEKRDKKKEKEKKKKHREKDKERERDKDRLKKIENKLKRIFSSKSSRCEIEDKNWWQHRAIFHDGYRRSSSATPSPSSLVGSKRDSVSPHKIIPKLYISKTGQGGEEKPKKSKVHGEGNKHKSSPITSVKSSPSSNIQTSPSPRSTPTPLNPRKTPTPPPKSTPALKESSHDRKKEKSSAKERKSRSPVKGGRKKKKGKDELSSLSEDSSLSPPTSLVKSTMKHRRQTPPKLQRESSSSPEISPPSLPFQSPSPSPQPSSRATRSPSHASSHRNSSVSPPPLSRNKPTPPPSLSPEATARHGRHHSPSPTKPPTPGSTSPAQSPDWNLPISPAHHRSPTPTPRTPTASPKRESRSPSHSSLPGSPVTPQKSTSPAARSTSRPGSRAVGSPEPYLNKDIPSPASSGKSVTSVSKPARTVEAETVCVYIDDTGQKIWICPACKKPDDGTEMVGCDQCDNWYHWPCVGITEAPTEEHWYCAKCLPKIKTSRGRACSLNISIKMNTSNCKTSHYIQYLSLLV